MLDSKKDKEKLKELKMALIMTRKNPQQRKNIRKMIAKIKTKQNAK